MLRYKGFLLLKRAMTMCSGLSLLVLVVPGVYIYRGVGRSFSLTRVEVARLDSNRFVDRLALLRTRCQAVDTQRIDYPKTLLYSSKLNLIYCPVPLTFSTNIKQAILGVEERPLRLKQLYNISTYLAIHSEAQALNLKHSVLLKPEKIKQISSHYTLLVVRDPWQRLAAIYYDLVVRRALYKTQCIMFVEVFSGRLKFDGFLKCLLYYANGTRSLRRLDSKLSPIHTMCSVCRVPYTTIVKYETISEDLYDLTSRKKNSAYTTFFGLYQQSLVMSQRGSTAFTDHYIGPIDKRVKTLIEDLYVFDFKLFGYTK